MEIAKHLGPLIALSIAVLLSSVPNEAEAQEPEDQQWDQARMVFEQGERQFAEDNFALALASFQRVYEMLDGHPRRILVQFNIARAHEELGDFRRARDAFRVYLEGAGPDAPYRAETERRVQELDARLRIAEGTSSGVEASAELLPVGTGREGAAEVSGLTIAGSIMAGAGLALGISSLVTGLVAHDIYGQLHCDAEGLCPAGTQPRIDEGYGLALSSTIMMPVAVAAGAAGLIMLFVGLAEPTREAASLTSGPGDLGLALSGAW